MTSAIDITKPVTGEPTTASVRANFATAKSEIEALQSSVAGLIGMGKNRLINNNFSINQRAVSGTVTLAAGAYGHDRWKAGSSGCTYTFSAVNGITTLNITAGSLQQVIEAANVPLGSNACCLSWSGTAQGKIGGGAYGASGISATVTGGANLTVEFNTGTLFMPQFEVGDTPTLFEQRHIAVEYALCQRYFQRLTTEANTQAVGSGLTLSATDVWIMLPYSQKIAVPTITLSANWRVVTSNTTFTFTAGTQNIGLSSATLQLTISGGIAYSGALLASAATGGAGAYIDVNAEL